MSLFSKSTNFSPEEFLVQFFNRLKFSSVKTSTHHILYQMTFGPNSYEFSIFRDIYNRDYVYHNEKKMIFSDFLCLLVVEDSDFSTSFPVPSSFFVEHNQLFWKTNFIGFVEEACFQYVLRQLILFNDSTRIILKSEDDTHSCVSFVCELNSNNVRTEHFFKLYHNSASLVCIPSDFTNHSIPFYSFTKDVDKMIGNPDFSLTRLHADNTMRSSVSEAFLRFFVHCFSQEEEFKLKRCFNPNFFRLNESSLKFSINDSIKN